MKRPKIATDFTNWLSSQYLKEDASEPLSRGFVSSRTGHSAIIFGYRWVLLGPLGVLQNHEKAKMLQIGCKTKISRKLQVSH